MQPGTSATFKAKSPMLLQLPSGGPAPFPAPPSGHIPGLPNRPECDRTLKGSGTAGRGSLRSTPFPPHSAAATEVPGPGASHCPRKCPQMWVEDVRIWLKQDTDSGWEGGRCSPPPHRHPQAACSKASRKQEEPFLKHTGERELRKKVICESEEVRDYRGAISIIRILPKITCTW